MLGAPPHVAGFFNFMKVIELENRVREPETLLSDERETFRYRMGGFGAELERQLEEKTRAAQALERMVTELNRKNTELTTDKGELRKQLDDTRRAGVLFMTAADEYQESVERKINVMAEEFRGARTAGVVLMNAAEEYHDAVEEEFKAQAEELKGTQKAGVLFMSAADEYQEAAEKELKTKVQELKDTTVAGLLLMNAADKYQEVVEKEYRVKVEELKDTRMAGLVLMDAANEYQEAVEREAKAKSMGFEELWGHKKEMDVRATSLKSAELKEDMAKKEELDTDVMVKTKRECEVAKRGSDEHGLKFLTLKQQHNAEVENEDSLLKGENGTVRISGCGAEANMHSMELSASEGDKTKDATAKALVDAKKAEVTTESSLC